jgi:hypothetical protein
MARNKVPYFPAHKTHRDFFVRNFRKKNNDEYFNFSNLLEENRVIYWKKTGLLYTKISNRNIIMPYLMNWQQISLSHDKDV